MTPNKNTNEHSDEPTPPRRYTRDYSSSSVWRCNTPHERLHRDSKPCTGSPPTSPIIDTPSKRERMERKKTAAMLENSQATDPTPSRPARSGLGIQAVVDQDTQEETELPANVEPENTGDSFSAFDPSSNNDQSSPEQPPHTPLQNTSAQQASDRIPETPTGSGGGNFPSSPPLPNLTAENLSILQIQSADQPPAPATPRPASSPFAVPASPPPASVWSMPSNVAHQIRRLMLRNRIDQANTQASSTQLVATQGHLSAARERTRHEAARSRAWRNTLTAVLVLCLAYVVWCYRNSAEFEFIDECRRKWYGL